MLCDCEGAKDGERIRIDGFDSHRAAAALSIPHFPPQVARRCLARSGIWAFRLRLRSRGKPCLNAWRLQEGPQTLARPCQESRAEGNRREEGDIWDSRRVEGACDVACGDWHGELLAAPEIDPAQPRAKRITGDAPRAAHLAALSQAFHDRLRRAC